MSRLLASSIGSRTRFPRVSGDEPGRGHVSLGTPEFSPRERG